MLVNVIFVCEVMVTPVKRKCTYFRLVTEDRLNFSDRVPNFVVVRGRERSVCILGTRSFDARFVEQNFGGTLAPNASPGRVTGQFDARIASFRLIGEGDAALSGHSVGTLREHILLGATKAELFVKVVLEAVQNVTEGVEVSVSRNCTERIAVKIQEPP